MSINGERYVTALSTIIGIIAGKDEDGRKLCDIRETAEQGLSLLFEREAMRIEFEDAHHNVSFIQHDATKGWTCVNAGGDRLSFTYPLGGPLDEEALIAELDAARTMLEVVKAVNPRIRRIVDYTISGR